MTAKIATANDKPKTNGTNYNYYSYSLQLKPQFKLQLPPPQLGQLQLLESLSSHLLRTIAIASVELLLKCLLVL